MSMAQRPPAVYEPGELDRIRRKLGDIDSEEAKRIASKLGGEVGVERGTPTATNTYRQPRTRQETVTVSVGGRGSAGPRPTRRVEMLSDDQDARPQRAVSPKRKGKGESDPEADYSDDPSVSMKATYTERLKMDRYAGQPEFEIKNSSQTFFSMISLFGEPADPVNSIFVTKRMNEYYGRLEALVASTRTLLPRNNIARAELLKKQDPFALRVLDTIRNWNIERLASDLSRLQAKPRDVVVGDMADILKAFYKPLYILGRLDPEIHVRDAFRALQKQLLMENPVEAKEKYGPHFRSALASYIYLARSVRFLLYPLLLKLLSDKWLSYEDFFMQRRRRFEAFLGVSEAERIKAPAEDYATAVRKAADVSASVTENTETDTTAIVEQEKGNATEESNTETAIDPGESNKAPHPRNRARDRGLETLESLFPQAGWQQLDSWPDLYPYFADVFDLKKSFEMVSPSDALHQVVILMHILEELFYGLRYVEFGTLSKEDKEEERADLVISRIIHEWHDYLEDSLGKEYLPRLTEYARLVDGSPESRTSNYAKRTLTELLWVKRLNFLPYLRFETSITSHPYRKQDSVPLYAAVRELRKILSGVAAGIEEGIKNKSSGPFNGIDNPMEPYNFQIPNPVSKRLDALLGGKNSKKKTNAALVFFALSVVVVLDTIINDKESHAYSDPADCPFRSINGEGIKPVFGVDQRVNADTLFKNSLKNKADQ